MKKIIELGGMGCSKCVDLVKKTLENYEGIQDVISVEVGKAKVVINNKFDEKKVAELLSENEFDIIAIHGE